MQARKPKSRPMVYSQGVRSKTVTVEILCMVVDTDGYPVDKDGDNTSKPWYEWDKRRLASKKFCPNDLANPKRRTVQYWDASSARVAKCNCHGKMHLI